VAVLLLVVTDVLILGVFLLVEGARDRLTTQLIPNRERPRDIVGVSY